jgi:hypothetical protein
MRKSGTFALAVVLLVIGVAAVLCVTYPAMQQKFAVGLGDFWESLRVFFGKLAEPFREAFVKG